MAFTVCQFEQKDRKVDLTWLSKSKIELKITSLSQAKPSGKCTAELRDFADNKDTQIPHYKLTFNFLECDPKLYESESFKEWQLIIRNPQGTSSDYSLSWSKFSEPDSCNVGTKTGAKKSTDTKRSTANVRKKK